VLVSLQLKGKTVLRKMEDNNYQIISLNAVELTEEEVRSACNPARSTALIGVYLTSKATVPSRC
jgi:hypothetical protein